MRTLERILVIRLGALGDLLLCFQAFQAIRNAHPKATIALITGPSFERFAKEFPWFNEVIVDYRPSWRAPREWWRLVKKISQFKPDRIYDLQGKFRQTILYFARGGPLGPEWSGAAPFCSHPRSWPPKPRAHFTEFIAEQLGEAGIKIPKAVELDWLTAPVEEFHLPSKFVILIPGCAPGREYKRWPASSYAELATRLEKDGYTSVVVGTHADASVAEAIQKIFPKIINLIGKTDLLQLGELVRRSQFVIGNDTGPTHLAAIVGAPTLAIISGKVDPNWSAPRGAKASWIQNEFLDGLSCDEVMLALHKLLDKTSLSKAS